MCHFNIFMASTHFDGVLLIQVCYTAVLAIMKTRKAGPLCKNRMLLFLGVLWSC